MFVKEWSLSARAKWIAALIFFLVVVSTVGALEKTVNLGRGRLWSDLSTANGVALRTDESGFPALALKTDEYSPSPSTDLLLHFNGGRPHDAAGNYNVLSSSITTSRKWARLGTASGIFQGEEEPLVLAPSARKALFAPGNEARSFSIEFWLYPATLSDGEELLLWRGARKVGGRILPQSVKCSIQSSKITWTFTNFFVPPSRGPFTVSLDGNTALIPRRWYHSTLRFDSSTGMIELLIDGQPDAIGYANRAGSENGTVFVPSIGSASESRLTIGSGYTGFLDELRISREFVTHPTDRLYAATPGVAITKPVDLQYTDSVVTAISATQHTPGNTAVFYYYRAANSESSPNELPGKWTQFSPNKPLPSEPRGKYIQFKIELLPGGSGDRAPTVSDLTFTYRPRLPPPAPAFLTATAGNGQVTLQWHAVIDPNLAGYEVFYGSRPHQYFGTGSSSGASPIDVGNKTSFDIKGLTNGKLYYFAVVAYDSSKPPHLSSFSNEVAARPSQLAGGGS